MEVIGEQSVLNYLLVSNRLVNTMEVIGEQSVLNYLLVSTRYARCSHRWGRSSSRRKVASASTASPAGRDHDRRPSGPSSIALAQGLASEEMVSCLWHCLAG